MQKIMLICLGGAVGALLRYGLSGVVHKFVFGIFPYGTFVVNVFGCFALGLLATVSTEKFLISSNMRIFLFIGLLGAFTTFSTFTYESIMLFKDGEMLKAIINVCLTFLSCFLFFMLGSYFAKII